MANAVVAPLNTLLNDVKTAITQLLATVEANILAGLNPIVTLISQVVNTAFGNITNFVSNLYTNLSLAIANGLNDVKTYISSLGQTIVNDVAFSITGAINTAINAAGFVSQFAQGIANSVANTFTAYIVDPIEAYLQPIVSAIVNSFTLLVEISNNFASDPFGTITTALANVQLSLNALLAPLQSALAPLFTAINSVIATVNGISSTITATVTQALSDAGNAVSAGYTLLYNAVFEYLVPTFINTLQNAEAAILSAIGIIPALAQSGLNAIGDSITSIVHDLGNLTEYVNSAFNQLATGINTLITNVGDSLSAFAGTLWSDFIAQIVQPAEQAVIGLGDYIYGAVVQWQRNIESGILALLPRTPQQAMDSATAVLELGIVSFAAGEALAIVADVVHPIKMLGAQQALHKGLELLGISEISAAMYGILVHAGWETQLTYYLNAALQPNRIDLASAQTAVYYGAMTGDDYINELRYAGFNDAAILAKVQTLYQPINARILLTLMEDNLVSDAYVIQQLDKHGYQASDSADILKALQFRAMLPFEANAKSLIFTYYKDGFMDDATATAIMTAFGTPTTQQAYVLALGRYQQQYEQKILARTYIVDLIKKAVITPDEGKADLQSLGMNADTANIIAQVAYTTALPSLTAAQKKALLATFIPDAATLAGA